MIDWCWCYENPKAAADEIEQLRETNKQLAIDAHREESALRQQLADCERERDELLTIAYMAGAADYKAKLTKLGAGGKGMK